MGNGEWGSSLAHPSFPVPDPYPRQNRKWIAKFVDQPPRSILSPRKPSSIPPVSPSAECQRNSAPAERTLLRAVGGKIPAHEAEHGLAAQLDRCAAPEAPHADDLTAELLDQVDEQLERRAGTHEVFDEQHLRALADEPLEFHGSVTRRLPPARPFMP